MTEQEPNGKLPLQFKGELGIAQADEIHQSLLAALGQSQWLELDLCQAREVGLCFLQLICAAHKSARLQGKRLSIAPNPSAEIRQAAARAGFLRERGCAGPEDTDCLWNLED